MVRRHMTYIIVVIAHLFTRNLTVISTLLQSWIPGETDRETDRIMVMFRLSLTSVAPLSLRVDIVDTRGETVSIVIGLSF